MNKFVPTCVEYFVQKSIFICVSPQTDKRVVIFTTRFLIAVIDDIAEVKLMEASK